MASRFDRGRGAALLGISALLLTAVGGCAGGSGGARLADAVDLGRSDKGELCRAERVWDDPAAAGTFDRAYNLRCRGWTDTQSAGRLYAISTRTSGATAELEKVRALRMVCGDPVSVAVPGLGDGKARRCVEREAGFPALSLTIERNGQIYEVEGLERFSANLDAGLTLLTGRGKLPAAGGVPENKIALGEAKLPGGAVDPSDVIDETALNSRRGEIIDYSVRGENVEAREIVTRYSARLPAGATNADRASFLLESALSESNLGYPDVASGYLDRAAKILDGPQAPQGSTGDLLRAKLHVYRALAALNQRSYPVALTEAAIGERLSGQLAGASLTAAGGGSATAEAEPLQDVTVLRDLNAQGADQRLRSAIMRPAQLMAQAQWVRAAALRQTGQLDKALVALNAASETLDRVQRIGGSSTSGLEWIRSQIAVQRGMIAEAQKRDDAARTYLTDSVAVLERANGYAGSPLLAQRKIVLATFLAGHGDRAEALRQYAAALAVMLAGGPSAAAAGNGLEGYFTLLAQDAQGPNPTVAAQARAQFFLAAQLVNPPAVAAQIAQIQKIFESGSSAGAVRAKTLQDLDRESRALADQITTMGPEKAQDRARLQQQLDDDAKRIVQVRAELAGDQQYLQANDSPATIEELQKALAPGEAYAKMLTLPRASYMIVVTHDAATLYPTALATRELTALIDKVRKSIDGNVAADGRVVPLVFNIGASADLYDALLGKAAPLLANVKVIISEPTGAMTHLPMGVLVADRASVEWFQKNVKINSRDYTKIDFLASRYDLDTTVSPRAFLVARAQPASRAANPYIGFGDHARPDEAELKALPDRGALAGRCSAEADALREGFRSLKPIGEKELALASGIAGAGSKVVEGQAFTDTALDKQRDYSGYEVVHFATHGLKEGELLCDSPPALITSIGDDPASDGLLSFEEIANLQFDANLVVLSACNTAAETTASRATGSGGFRAGRAGQGATLNGLVRAFLVAGSRTVLTTHWAIPDSFSTRDGRQVAASTQLIETFFRTGTTESIASALRTAQTRMIDQVDTSHPYYWGAFAIVGDGEKHMFARAS